MINSTQRQISKKKGAVYMFVVLILTVTTTAIAIGFTQPNIREYRNSIRENLSNNAFLFAEAGNEDIFYRVKSGMNAPSPSTMILNDSYATTTKTVIDANTLDIETESSIEKHTRKSKLRVSNLNVSAEFLYGAQIGSWGVDMANNTEVRGVLPAVGDIYANGSIRGTGFGTVVTGNAFSSTGIIQDNIASSTSCLGDVVVGKVSPEVDYAQSFVANASADSLDHVDIYVRKTGNPNSRTVRIVADDGGVPDDATITSGTLDRNKVTSLYSWVSVFFDSLPR